MTYEETLQLIAKVLAWQDGCTVEEIGRSINLLYLDGAQQCAEDLGLA